MPICFLHQTNRRCFLSDSATHSDNPGQASTQPRSDLKTRLISAAVGIPVVLLAIWAGVPGVIAITAVAAVIAGYELCEMAKAPVWQRPVFVLGPLLIVLAQIWWHVDDSAAVTVLVLVVSLPIAISVLTVLYKTSRLVPPGSALGIVRNKAVQRFALFYLAVAYFGFTFSHTVPLIDLADGRSWLLLAILGTFAVDTGAYFTGRAIGRHKLAPAISPKKTWEGVFGGALAAIGAVIGLTALLDLPVAVWEGALLGLALAVAGVGGDLFESWLKRKANVKDSGKIIPGHGGILDRIDSLAPNLAVVYWATQLLEI